MTGKEETNSIKKTARVAGLLYLLLAAFAVFSFEYVPSVLIVPEDAAATADNIVASERLLRLGIVGSLIMSLVHIFLALVLYKVLKPVGRNVALLMVIFTFLVAPIVMLNEVNRVAVLQLLNGAGHLAAFTADQLQALVSLFIDLHEHGLDVATVFWGLWLLPMGYLVFKSGFLPKIIGILLMIACFGYLVDSAASFLFPDSGVSIGQFTFIGELLLLLWLLIRGVNVEQWEKRARETG